MKSCTRPPPPGLVNSLSSMPILRITHSSESTEPVENAISGMSPWASPAGHDGFPVRQLGMVVSVVGTTVFVQEATLEMTICRRHRPFWMTRGMLAPTGMLVRVKVPSTAVAVLTRGDPLTSEPQLQCGVATPSTKGWTAELGT